MTATPPARSRPSRQTLLIALVILVGVLLGALILSLSPDAPAKDEHGHAAQADDHAASHEHSHDAHADAAHAPAADHGQSPGSAPAHSAPHDEHDDHAAHADTVTLTQEQIQRSGLPLASAGPVSMDRLLPLTGEIRLNQDHTVQVVPRLAGVVEAAPVSAGDSVRKGQVLALLSSQELAEQRSALLVAQQRLALAQGIHDREKTLWQEKISAEADYRQARSALEEARIAVRSAEQRLAALGSSAAVTASALTRHAIRAPIAGVVIDKQLAVGQVVSADVPIFVVADLSSVWVETSVRAQDLGSVRVGQRARVDTPAFAVQGSAQVRHISALVGEQTRTAIARLVLPNPDGLWRPGLPVRVTLATATQTVPVAVANTALQTLDQQPVVFVRTENGFVARAVQTGASDARHTAIVQGLQAGEVYAADHSFLLKAELGKASASHDH